MQRLVMSLAIFAAVLAAGCAHRGGAARDAMWIDMYAGEPVSETELIDDLAAADVIYLGERHTVGRHHALQTWVIDELGQRGAQLAIGMEMLQATMQPALDRYSAGEIDFDTLAGEIGWAESWLNYADYRTVLETGRRHGARIVGLNADPEVIRSVARKGGVANLDPAERATLPEKMWLNDPDYETLLNIQMGVHQAATPDYMKPMMQAQMARDAMMASRIVAQLEREPGRKVVVLCGAGHVNYGLGTPDRVRRQKPEVRDRIVVMSESGDVVLSPEMQKAAQSIEYTHDDLRPVGRPLANYAHVAKRADKQ